MKKRLANRNTMKKTDVIKLLIDTSRSDVIRVALEKASGGGITKERDITVMKTQEALGLIEEVLKENNIKRTDITGIEVNIGPGSYTGLRVGTAIANMLGTLLGIPINGLPVGQTVTPVYEDNRW